MPGTAPAELVKGFETRRPAAVRPLRRGAARLRAAERLLREARGLRADHVDAPADAVRTRGLAHRSRGVRARPRRRDRPARPGRSRSSRDACESDLTRDDLLDNITLYWLTNTGVSAARLYWENKADFFDAKDITIPFAISVFPDELYQAPRSWAERAYPDNLIHYNRLDRGGHFAAWEQPQLFSRRAPRRVQVAAHVEPRSRRRTRRPSSRSQPASSTSDTPKAVPPTVRRSFCCTAGRTTSTPSPRSRRCWRRRATG